MLAGIALSLLLVGAVEQPTSRLAVIRQAPDFALVNQDGKPAKLSDHRGKVLLVSFIFTTCSGSCPATTHRMAKVQQTLESSGLAAGQKVQFLSISLDPERDTPEALRNYMRLYDIAGKDWSFVTGEPAAVAKTIAEWAMWVKPAANGQLDHPSRIFLVDQELRIREIYNVDLLRPEDVVEDIRLLFNEAAVKK